jgi:hypothetical protein
MLFDRGAAFGHFHSMVEAWHTRNQGRANKQKVIAGSQLFSALASILYCFYLHVLQV